MAQKTKKDTNDENEKKDDNSIIDFFSKWFFIGTILILISIIWEQLLGANDNSMSFFLQSIGTKFVSTIGISIFVGSIFNWIIGTQNFSNYVKSKIVNVLISKDYIGDLEIEKKKSMLMSIMRPKKSISSIYSRIDDYFKLYAKKSMNLFKEQQFRSNVNFSGRARRNKNGQVYIDYKLMYRTYVVDSEHKDLETGFNDNKLSCIKETRVALPDKSFKKLEVREISKEQASSDYLRNDSVTQKVQIAILPNDDYRKANYLNVEQDGAEYGDDHWINFSYRSSKPTDAMTMMIECDDDLVVKDAVPYGPMNSFDINISEDKKNISVVCNKWMDPGYGVNILIAKNSNITPATIETKPSKTEKNKATLAQEQKTA